MTPIPSRTVTPSILTLAAAMVLGGCKFNEATGERQWNLLSTEQEIALGAEAEPQFIAQNGGVIPAPEVRQYVSNLGRQLAATSEQPELPWEFHVLNTDVINAFALPGGKVFITRGLLSRMNNEAQLAGVLGHEIGHVTAEHTDQRMAYARGVQIAAAGLGVAAQATDQDWLRVLGLGTQIGGTGFGLKFSRDDETQADELGVRYMAQAGYNPKGQVQVMEILKAASGGGGGPEFLATHPLPETRIKRLNKHIKDEFDLGRGDGYTFGERSFEQNVLQPLRQLPPAPRQQPQAQ